MIPGKAGGIFLLAPKGVSEERPEGRTEAC